MAFRTLEITQPTEIHVQRGQLVMEQEAGTVSIPLEDIATIVCNGSNIRLSTMGLAQIAEHGVSFMVLDSRYSPAGMFMPQVANVRQTGTLYLQLEMEEERKESLWRDIIRKKIDNQSRVLSILGLDGPEQVVSFIGSVDKEPVDPIEAAAARTYFQHLHPGLNRRNDDPFNSCLNYGYAVVRNAIIRSLLTAGFQPALGLHHCNHLNPFNLADDLIEPWRPMVDLIACECVSSSTLLSKKQRKELAMVLHHACKAGEKEVTVLTGIDMMIASLHRAFQNESNTLQLPTVMPVKELPLINE